MWSKGLTNIGKDPRDKKRWLDRCMRTQFFCDKIKEIKTLYGYSDYPQPSIYGSKEHGSYLTETLHTRCYGGSQRTTLI